MGFKCERKMSVLFAYAVLLFSPSPSPSPSPSTFASMAGFSIPLTKLFIFRELLIRSMWSLRDLSRADAKRVTLLMGAVFNVKLNA